MTAQGPQLCVREASIRAFDIAAVSQAHELHLIVNTSSGTDLCNPIEKINLILSKVYISPPVRLVARGVQSFLDRIADALDGIEAAWLAAADDQDIEEGETIATVLKADASKARAFVRLVADCLVIGSQLIDNLNASVHLRASLTTLFIVDERAKAGHLPELEA